MSWKGKRRGELKRKEEEEEEGANLCRWRVIEREREIGSRLTVPSLQSTIVIRHSKEVVDRLLPVWTLHELRQVQTTEMHKRTNSVKAPALLRD